jgi:triphosphoribosyl-dephospho-CoA synthase
LIFYEIEPYKISKYSIKVSPLDASDISKYVRNCASLAALLEVSAYPKPGNIHRLSDFQDTQYEHFLAGGVVLGSVMGELAKKSSSSLNWSEVGLGYSIKAAVDEMYQWQSGGNIHLGVILLFAPLSASAGAILSTRDLSAGILRDYTNKIISKATADDTIAIYQAIDRAMSPENLGSVEKLDVKNIDSSIKIRQENITPLKIFEICKSRDLICREWVTGFRTVFETGYPYIRDKINSGISINDAIVNTFLKILSENPDSLIARKSGKKTAECVSMDAKKILDNGGSETDEGIKRLWEFDDALKKEMGKLNPGTTADLTAASIFVLLLAGWRP